MGLEAKRIKRKLNRLLGQSYGDLKVESNNPNYTMHQAQRKEAYYGGRIEALRELTAFIDTELKKV
jgi:hypothetical protein